MAEGTESSVIEALVEEGLQLYSQGRLQDAIAKWNEALAQEPGHPRAQDYIRYVEENRPALEASFQLASVSSEALRVVGDGASADGAQEDGEGAEVDASAEDSPATEAPEEMDAEPKAGAGAEAEAGVEAEAGPKLKAEEGAEAAPSPEAAAEAEPGPDVEAKAEAEAGPNLGAEAKPDVGEPGTELELEAEPESDWPEGSGPEEASMALARGGAAAEDQDNSRRSITAEQQRALAEDDPRKTLPLPGIGQIESTARMNVEELQSKVDLTKQSARPTPAMHSPMLDVEVERSRRPTPLMVVSGDGESANGGFEPMENTPVGIGLPQPARLVPEADEASFAELQKTPVVVPPADLFEEESHPPTPASAVLDGDERVSSMLSGARQLHDQGTYEGSLWLCERVLAMDTDNAEARELLEKNRAILLEQSKEQIGDLAEVPVIQIPQHEIMWHKLDHRAGFLLSRIDGQLSFEEVIDVSGMGEFEASRILSQLMALGVIGPRR